MALSRTHFTCLSIGLALCLPDVGAAAGLATKQEKKPAAKPAPKAAPKAKKKVSKKRGETKKNDEEEETQWAIGLTGGGNFASIGGDPLGGVEGTETNMNTGFALGLIGLYNLASFADFEFGLGYSTKGYSREAQTKDPTRISTTTIDDTFSYVELPLGIRLNYPAGSIRPYLGLGVYAGFGIGSERSETVDTDYQGATGPCPTANDPGRVANTCSSTANTEVPGANSFDFGLKVQLGAEFDVTDALSVFIGGGYSRSFTDPVDESKWDVTAPAAAATPAAGTDPAPAAKTSLKNTSQAHSVIQGVAGLLYAF